MKIFVSFEPTNLNWASLSLVLTLCGSRYSWIHGSWNVRRAVWRVGRCVCIWHVYVGDGYARVSLHGVPECCPDLQTCHAGKTWCFSYTGHCSVANMCISWVAFYVSHLVNKSLHSSYRSIWSTESRDCMSVLINFWNVIQALKLFRRKFFRTRKKIFLSMLSMSWCSCFEHCVYVYFQGIPPDCLAKVENSEIYDIIQGCTKYRKEER